MSLDEAPCRLPSVLAMPKVVRDLLWTVTSPHMLSGDRFPVLPAEFGVQALKSDAAIDWVNALVADPTPLVTFVEEMTSNGRSLALGVYFSTLLEFWLRFCPHLGVEKMEIGKQIVSSTNRTVGQLKFLFRCNFPVTETCEQRDFHVESSVKFFLLNPMDVTGETISGFVPLEQFVGPHLGENLAWRVQEVDRKLAMRRGESVRAWLKENYSDRVQSHIVLRGYLFQPLSHLASTSETTVAHDWHFHRNPHGTPVNGSASLKALTNPSIAADHLRGWWTTDMETDLPAKVRANDRNALGGSRFVILPKLHWLSPVVAVEDAKSGQVVVQGDVRLDVPLVEALTLEELMEFVRDHFKKVASSAETNKSGGVAMPLLVAELVRCPLNAIERTAQHWYELSRGFILDPRCWDPSPLCREPVRFRRTLRRNVATGIDEREYEPRRSGWGSEGFVKPDAEQVAAQQEQKRHQFVDPASVGPRELARDLVALLRAEKVNFSHAELKRSTKELLLARRQHGDLVHRHDESAYLRSCLESLILDANGDDDSKLARRVGYLLLDVFAGLNRESSRDEPGVYSSQECSGWAGLLAEVAQASERWEFLNLVLRAIDVTLSTAQTKQWGGSDKGSKLGFLDKLLAARSPRWNAVVVEVIRVLSVGELVPGLKSTADSRKVQSIFAAFVAQRDWQSAERLVIVVQDHDMMLILFKHLSLLNMTKALKRLEKVAAGIPNSATEAALACAMQSSDLVTTDEVASRVRGVPIDHAKNRVLSKEASLEFKWKYVDSLDGVKDVVRHLEQRELIVQREAPSDEQAVLQSVLVGIDCEWRPQFLVKDRASIPNAVPDERSHSETVAHYEEPNNQVDEDQAGLSIFQLAVGNVVYVVDVQVLGAAAAAPLQFIWRPASRLVLIGFCVSSDIQRIKNSFPELHVLFDSASMRNTRHATPLLLELKELALYRQVPAKTWGLSRLYRACLGDQVDKEQQCSDWGSRPLSNSQLEYAAKDAFAVQRLAVHLLADVSFARPGADNCPTVDRVLDFMKTFDASRSFSHAWAMTSVSQPLGKPHVEAALKALGVQARFLKCDGSGREGLLVKSIALLARREKQANAPRRIVHAVAVLPLDRSIDMQALGTLLGADPGDLSLADQETLVRVFGYSRGCLGPIGLREQQATQIILDAGLQSEDFLLCGAGVADEVYAIPPHELVTAVGASFASISRQNC